MRSAEGDRPIYTVCLYHSGLAASLERFVQQVWPKHTSTQKRNSPPAIDPDKSKEKKSPIFLFLKNQEILGHLATVPVRLYSSFGIQAAHWVVGFMVLPQYRNGPIGPLLIRKVNETIEFALTLHVEEAPLKIFKGLGWKHAGVLPQFVLLQNPYALLKNLRIRELSLFGGDRSRRLALIRRVISKPSAQFVLALLVSAINTTVVLCSKLRRPRRGQGEVSQETRFDADYDKLWENVKMKFGPVIVRDQSYLEARFGQWLNKYVILTYRHHKQLLGYCVLKRKQFDDDSRMGNMRLITIVDCLFDPVDLTGLQSLVDAVIQLGRREKVHAIFCTASYAPLQRLLSRNGFLKIPGSLNFAYYDKTGVMGAGLPIDSWHLMRGDSDADANF